jgi:hypothetical protein
MAPQTTLVQARTGESRVASKKALGRAALVAALLTSSLSPAEAAGNQVDVQVQVAPFVQIQILGTGLLYLAVPPAGSTVPSAGVTFTVTGNSFATVIAEPSSFVQVPTLDYPGGEYMGRAVLNGNPVGYRLRLDFPVTGVVGSPVAHAGLPGFEAGPTTPPLTVNMNATGGTRNGRIHMEASHEWTPDNGLPLPGVYVGSVTITVTAN